MAGATRYRGGADAEPDSPGPQVPFPAPRRSPSGPMGRVPSSGPMGRVPSSGPMSRVLSGPMERVPSGPMGRVPSGPMERVPSGPMGRVPSGPMGRVPSGPMERIPPGPRSSRVGAAGPGAHRSAVGARGTGAGRHRRRSRRRARTVVGRHAPRVRAWRRADRCRPDLRPVRRLRSGRPGRADGQAAAAGTRHRLGPAGPLARRGRQVRRLYSGDPRAADHLGIRRDRAHRAGLGDRHAAAQLPGRAHGHRRGTPAGGHRHHVGSRGTPPHALRNLVLPALLHVPGDRARVQPPVRRRRPVHHQPVRPLRLVRPCTSSWRRL